MSGPPGERGEVPIVRRARERSSRPGGRGYALGRFMRILHVADRLTDRGGAYTWMLGVLEALAEDHEVRLVVGEDDGAVTPPCTVDVRPGLEAREAAPVELDDLVARLRPRRRARAQRGEPRRAGVGRLAPERAPHRAGPPLLLPDAGQVDARRRGLPAADDARGLRFLLRGPGLLPRGPRAHGAAPPRGTATAAHRALALHAGGARGGRRVAPARARRPALRPSPRPRGGPERPAVRALRGPARGGEGRARRGRGVAPLGCRPSARAGRDGAAARGAHGAGGPGRGAGARGASAGSSATGSRGSTAGRARSCCRRAGRSPSASWASRR